MEKDEILWSDRRWKNPGIYVWFFLLMGNVFFLLLVWNEGLLDKLFFGAFTLISLYSMLVYVTYPMVKFSKNKIITHRLSKVKKGVYKIKKRKVEFIWKDISMIRIRNYLVGESWVKAPSPFIEFSLKNRRVIRSKVFDLNRFIRAVKDLGKGNLLEGKNPLAQGIS